MWDLRLVDLLADVMADRLGWNLAEGLGLLKVENLVDEWELE